MDEGKNKKWYMDSEGKISSKRILGASGFILVLTAWIITGFNFYKLDNNQIEQVPIILGIFGAMMAAGGFTKGG